MLLSQSSSLLWSTFIFILLNLSMKKSIANIKVNSPLSTSPTNALSQEKININADSYVIGVDAGTESIRVGIFTRTGHMISTSVVPWKTTFPQPGWAEQSPNEWWKAFGQACQQAVKSIDVTKIVGISIDTTACSVVILDENFKPLRPCLLWMDGRSAPQCQEILQEGKGDPALQVNCNGEGPLSAEWMIPKALWIKQNEPLLWKQARIVCEKQDYFNLMVTGKLVSSSCNVAARWHWNAEEACNSVITSGHESSLDVSFNSKRHQGRPVTLLERIGLTDLLDKWPLECIAMGDIVGTVSESAARHLGIPVGIPVTQGGPDAYVGMIGLGSVVPNELSLITGSSHLHLAVSELPATAPGVWGAYQGAPLVGLCFAEGGQCSTGSVLSWARRLLDNNYQQQLQQHTESKTSGLIDSSGTTHTTTATPIAPTPTLAYDILNAEASRIEAGSDGLLCIETFQGARTPVTDPLARGAFLGLSLAHTRGHLWRSILEGVCLGTKGAIDALAKAGLTGTQIKVAGGATRSELFLQMHADATGLPVVVTENDNAPLLGSALLAGVGVGWFKSSDDEYDKDVYTTSTATDTKTKSTSPTAISKDDNLGTQTNHNKYTSIRKQVYRGIQSMIRVSKRIEPNITATNRYKSVYKLYSKAVNRIADISHTLATGTHFSDANSDDSSSSNSSFVHIASQLKAVRDKKRIQLAPSLLSADFGHLASEAKLCEKLGLEWLHIDVCDGSEECRGSFTIGPQTVAAIRRECPNLKLDVHLVASDTEAWVTPMAAAGATRFILQYESVCNSIDISASTTATTSVTDRLLSIAHKVRQSGMSCGICIKPSTPIIEIESLLLEIWTDGSPLFELVDILTVNPGHAGQIFNIDVLEKVKYLVSSVSLRHAVKYVAVDGGVNENTIKLVVAAGANVIVAGSAVFGSNRCISQKDEPVIENIQKLISTLLNK